jgi:hypothetical protein
MNRRSVLAKLFGLGIFGAGISNLEAQEKLNGMQ